MKYPEYQPGARWEVRGNGHKDFDFVIVGPGSKPKYKLCRVEYLTPNAYWANFEAEYSHTHLRTVAVYRATPTEKTQSLLELIEKS